MFNFQKPAPLILEWRAILMSMMITTGRNSIWRETVKTCEEVLGEVKRER